MPAARKDSDDQISQANPQAADAARNASEEVARASSDIAQRSTETVQEIMRSGVETANKTAQRSLDQFASVFGFSGREAQEAAEQSSRNLQAVAECGTVLARGVEDISREWLDWAQQRFQSHLDGLNALLRCRTPQDFVAVQSDQVRQNLELLIESTRRVAERSVQLAEAAGETIAVQADETAGRARRSSDRARRAA
jgi:hypothetical protein